MLRLGFPVVGVTDLPRAVAFWTAALEVVAADDGHNATWQTLEHADGSGQALGLMRSESPAAPRPRIHLDLYVDTAAEQDTEVERLLGLGASKPDWDLYPPDPDFVVLADPDGNLFCVVNPSAPSAPDKA